MEGPSNANRHPQLGPRRPALRALKTPTEINDMTSKKVSLKRKRVRFLDLEESCPLILLPLEETSGGNREDDEVVIVKVEEVEADSDAESNDGGDQDRLVTMDELKQEDVTMDELKQEDVTMEQVKEDDVTMDQVKEEDMMKKAETLETELKEKNKQLSEERERLKALEDELFGATFLIRDLREDLETKEEEMEAFKRITQETQKKLGRELEKQLIISGEGEGRIMQLENQVQEKDKQMEGLRRQLEREREVHRWDTEQLNLIIRGNNQQIKRLKNLLLGGSTEEGEREGSSENCPPVQLDLVGGRDSRNYNLASNSSGIDEEPKNTAAASFNQ